MAERLNLFEEVEEIEQSATEALRCLMKAAHTLERIEAAVKRIEAKADRILEAVEPPEATQLKLTLGTPVPR